MRRSWLLVLALSSVALAGDPWWRDLFRAEDTESPPRPDPRDPLVVDGAVDGGADGYRGLLWMSVVARCEGSFDLGEVFRSEEEMKGAQDDVVKALLMAIPSHAELREDAFSPMMRWKPMDLDDLRTLIARYQESQGISPRPVVVGQTIVVPAAYDSEGTIGRWMNRNLVAALPDVLVKWGRDLAVVERFSWNFSRDSHSGDPTLRMHDVEESVKQVNIRVLQNLQLEVGVRRELLDNRPEDDLFEGGSGGNEPFASLMWKF